jgi:hypothetical protein
MDTDNTDMVEGGEEDSVVDELNRGVLPEMKAARPDMGEMFGEDEDATETPSSASKEMDSNGSTTEETEVANGNSCADGKWGPQSRSWEE